MLLDYPFLFAVGKMRVSESTEPHGLDFGMAGLINDEVRLGYRGISLRGQLVSLLPRIAMHTGIRSPDDLRIPAGKTMRERMVPLHEEAARALLAVIEMRKKNSDRPVVDERTGERVRFLFYRRGVRISADYLFQYGLNAACKRAGLVDGRGRATISAHRFRHTVGTQLAERGAKLHTIMSVLGHQSPHMSMAYARISDAEVLRDYQSVLGPGASIAGPGAEAVRAGTLSNSAVDWLKSNFFRTELEFGHCLRLPSEGPCECNLYLSCPKFVTTPAYAPRLRERYQIEQGLAEDARQKKWPKEVERHCNIAERNQGPFGAGSLNFPPAVSSRSVPLV